MSETYAQLRKNTVPADRQLKETDMVRFYNLGGTGKRVMFIGNSITLHAPRPEIGWHYNWGMAASSAENDYVHRLMAEISQLEKDPVFCVCQVALWETNYKQGESQFHLFENARNFQADILVARFNENAVVGENEPELYKAQLLKLLQYLNPEGNGKLILTTGFWRHPADNAVAEAATQMGWPLVTLNDLGERDEMKALGQFEHRGVSVHPGDLGMKTIAERIFSVLKEYLA